MSNTFKNVLIVLGCRPNYDGRPSNYMINRVRKAIQLYNRNNYSKIIFSGGNRYYPVPESEIMRIMAMKYIPPEKITVERNSTDTIHNALFCWELIKDENVKHVTVVTSEWHVPRAKYIFKKLYEHMDVTLQFEGVTDNVDIVETAYRLLKEKILLTKLKWFGIK